MRSISQVRSGQRLCARLLCVGALTVTIFAAVSPSSVLAQSGSTQPSPAASIQGTVLDRAERPVDGAVVSLERDGGQNGVSAPTIETTGPAGGFAFLALESGRYAIRVEKAARHIGTTIALSSGDRKHIDLTLADGANDSTTAALSGAMQFADQPNFTVAGVTDWTAVGGHGSDSSLRTSEALARETLTLKADDLHSMVSPSGASQSNTAQAESDLRSNFIGAPASFEANHLLGEFYCHAGRFRESIPLLQTAYKIDPANRSNEHALAFALAGAGDFTEAREHARSLLARAQSADLYSLSAELDEKLGDPLAAVHEYEQAVRLDSSEPNYFAWGSELLIHRAVWQAQEVFRKGIKAYPESPRMLTALGASLFASGLYEEAAGRVCEASDLNPSDPAPYIFLGKIDKEAPMPLACVAPKLARFVKLQPGDALANYYYAMALWKRQTMSPDLQVQALLTRAVALDDHCAEAYLQLGILSFVQRDYDRAIGLYMKAIGADPQLGEAHYRLGVAYDRTGEAAKAKHEFELHDEIEKRQLEAVEQQRREVKQFLVVLQGKPANSSVQ